ncbi:hypothetical protein MUP95_03665 [bacterium]|nr:hypothetical protein [bacterium]
MDQDNAGVTFLGIRFCDFRCKHAAFPKDEGIDGSGSCRTFSAVWCEKLQEYVTKNAPCPLQFGKRRPKSKW